MKVALISLFTPTAENRGGASALPYHLIAFRPEDVHVDVFTWNYGNLSISEATESCSALGADFHLLPIPKWYKLIRGGASTVLRALLPYPPLKYFRLSTDILNVIKSEYDAVWIYGEELANLSRLFPSLPVVVTTPDCEAMYYSRILSLPEKLTSRGAMIRFMCAYSKYLRLARSFEANHHVRYHLVGKEDRDFLKSINPELDARFLPHPHYNYINRPIETPSDDSFIRLLITGRYDFYMREAADEAIRVLADSGLQSKYEITFLGRGWEDKCEILRNAGYKTTIIKFAPVYAEELCRHHIQLAPITTGTGTKGKVLDAMSNGLLTIGTVRALENIAGQSGKDFIRYNTGQELSECLRQLASDRTRIATMATSGRDKILIEHGRQAVSEEFFRLFNQS